jgi:hypothetical protein
LDQKKRAKTLHSEVKTTTQNTGSSAKAQSFADTSTSCDSL